MSVSCFPCLSCRSATRDLFPTVPTRHRYLPHGRPGGGGGRGGEGGTAGEAEATLPEPGRLNGPPESVALRQPGGPTAGTEGRGKRLHARNRHLESWLVSTSKLLFEARSSRVWAPWAPFSRLKSRRLTAQHADGLLVSSLRRPLGLLRGGATPKGSFQLGSIREENRRVTS